MFEPLNTALLDWYTVNARDLPWRRTADPYAILVSEVMLQQTQVARVVPRYEAWLARWPSAAALAAAPRGDVLAAWVGLGYNARAHRLQAACARVTREGWPRTAEGLRSLPGVGAYSAAAVACFAFGEAIAAVDVNVARVAARVGLAEPQRLLAEGRAAEWNQAMMELGATTCRARTAACAVCPLTPWCASAGQVPTPEEKPPRGRFEDSNRWVRGRVVAALAAGHGVPRDIPADRLQAGVDSLLRDGLVVRGECGLGLG